MWGAVAWLPTSSGSAGKGGTAQSGTGAMRGHAGGLMGMARILSLWLWFGNEPKSLFCAG